MNLFRQYPEKNKFGLPLFSYEEHSRLCDGIRKEEKTEKDFRKAE